MRFLRANALWVLVFLFVVSAVSVLAFVNRVQGRLVSVMALQNAEAYSQAISEFRTLYTSEVVSAVRNKGILVTHDYKERPGAIPLPATLSMLLGKRIGESGSGVKTQLYSDFPFPWRRDGGLKDAFQRSAWAHFEQDPNTSYYRFETVDGRPSLRFATADLMRPSCVQCHNTHPESPKTDWRTGDVRGVLEISLPLDAAVAQTRSGLQGSVALLFVLALASVAGLGLVVHRGRFDASALVLSESRFRQLIEGSVEGILIHRGGMPLFVNQAFASIFGFDTPADLLAFGALDSIIPPPYDGAQGTRKDGSVVWLESVARDIEWEGRPCVQITSVDVSERKRLEGELLAVVANEQRRLGHDLHDGLGQQLTGISLLTKALERELIDKNPELAEQARKIVEHSLEAIRQSRRVVQGLVPVELEARGLARVLEQFAIRASSLFGIAVTVNVADVPDFDLDVALHLYRVVQEAVHNAVRHGHARSVTIETSRDNEMWTLSITDDGEWRETRPNTDEEAEVGMGLRVMQYRAKLIGAALHVEKSGPTRGTSVRCVFASPAVR